MRTAFHYVIRLALALAAIIGVGKLCKLHDRYTIDANDNSVDQIQYPPGTYRVNTYLTIQQVQQNDMLVYTSTAQVDQRVAHVAAVEGQTVELTEKGYVVDGKQTRFTASYSGAKFPPLKVPHGCVFLLCDKPAYNPDSSTLGPIPWYAVYGKLNL